MMLSERSGPGPDFAGRYRPRTPRPSSTPATSPLHIVPSAGSALHSGAFPPAFPPGPRVLLRAHLAEVGAAGNVVRVRYGTPSVRFRVSFQASEGKREGAVSETIS